MVKNYTTEDELTDNEHYKAEVDARPTDFPKPYGGLLDSYYYGEFETVYGLNGTNGRDALSRPSGGMALAGGVGLIKENGFAVAASTGGNMDEFAAIFAVTPIDNIKLMAAVVYVDYRSVYFNSSTYGVIGAAYEF